jgi:glycosyltransferase involved in cell wall biosynthesis
MPEISVIIPTHDRWRLLLRALRTVLAQRGVDIEAIVADDGSTDGTAERVDAVRDERVRLIRVPAPGGVSAARNLGLEAAAASWVAFLDDDDLWAPTKLSEQLAAAANADAKWAYAGSFKIDDHDRIIGGNPPPSPGQVMAMLRTLNPVPGGCSGVLADRSTVLSVGAFDPTFVNLADWDLWIRLGESGSPACAGRPLVAYRLHRGQASLDVELIRRESQALQRKHGITIDRGGFAFYLAHKCLLAGLRRAAVKQFAVAAAHGYAGEVSAIFLQNARTRIGRAKRPKHAQASDWLDQASPWFRSMESSIVGSDEMST